MMNISNNIAIFMEGRKPGLREASFDYCFNYFQEFRRNDTIKEIASPENMQMSCLQLYGYLASWGMLRGKAFMLQRSYKHLEELICAIAKMKKVVWEIDADNYTEENMEILINTHESIKNLFAKNGENASVTLTTKIMLGVFGNVPAFDENFCKSFHVSSSSINIKDLSQPKFFYIHNKDEFDKFDIKTIDFKTGQLTDISYTKAKLIDMVGWIGDEA